MNILSLKYSYIIGAWSSHYMAAGFSHLDTPPVIRILQQVPRVNTTEGVPLCDYSRPVHIHYQHANLPA